MFWQNCGYDWTKHPGIEAKLDSLIWLVVIPYPPEKYEFVSWDDDIPNMESHKIPWFQTTSLL